jgi:hypothetical protein
MRFATNDVEVGDKMIPLLLRKVVERMPYLKLADRPDAVQ